MILDTAAKLCLAVLFLLSLSHHQIFARGDADFLDVRTNLDRDRSGKRGDPKDKYFHESVFHPHYDGRFAATQLGKEDRLPHLTALMQTFLATMADIGAETWIMHGTLLGWWWNQKILPWDSDIDVQVSERTIAFLAKFYNMTEYHFRLPGVKNGRTYLLEVNPHYTIRGIEDKLNVIDARWIDTETGLFIDISTVRANYTARAEGIEGALMCKDKHHYLERDIFPLRDSFFEGIHVKIPFEYASLLEEEYGKKALTLTTYEHHKFNTTSKLWEPMKNIGRPARKRPPSRRPPSIPVP
ncbi:mannosyltransferase [Elasticomyces elasticus]|uniref:Mannosyltransferase n=1 Tax=Exophiala sideris TaxID=1016849 RepID=A0ABR0IZ66_9EURO|nr:mannosyltransferase [Elasticomyces elasticus]KAK5022959.1 mannosyltransferase [Exophiala sideris]KAK5026362.1 mannosyltransferase [Exophiala sideris]KAK5052296.1 mannosyltransferase [Exophiala sideris]KAK5177324.1 mannosyltransferase [Eurotiomycetes sp. CCFEE 6388]